MNVINKKGEAINRDKWKVYCTGDLIDGGTNRAGDILNMEYAPEWFDAVCLGNHEMAFIGGHDFGSRRKHDRKTLNLLLELIDQDIYVPSILIDDYLLVHGGFTSRFGFESAADAHEYIKVMWKLAPDFDGEIAIFDWQGVARSYGYGDNAGSIFELDWHESRNKNFHQVVGHSTHYDGPILKECGKDDKIQHWNIDIGGKSGKCIGGIIYDDVSKEVEEVFWGERAGYKSTIKTTAWNASKANPVESPKKPLIGTVAKPVVSKPVPVGTSVAAKLFKGIRVEDFDNLDEIDIKIINDPEIIEAFNNAIAKDDEKSGLIGKLL